MKEPPEPNPEAVNITYEFVGAVPRELVMRLADTTGQFRRLLDGREPDTPEARAAAFAEVAAVLDDAHKLPSVPLLWARRRRGRP
jgi:hypothetical protein